MLVKRSNLNRPDCGLWAIPGGWVFDEDLSAQGGEPADKDFDSARRRICLQKIHPYTNFISDPLVDGNPKRDPSGWSISISHYALLNHSNVTQIVEAGMDKSRVNWFALETILQGKQVLAFDHVAQIQHAWKICAQPLSTLRSCCSPMSRSFGGGYYWGLRQILSGRQSHDNKTSADRYRVIVSTNKIATSSKGKGGKPATVYRLASNEVIHFQT